MWVPCAERPTTNFGSCVRWYARCLLILVSCLSRRSLQLVCTTATHCCIGSATIYKHLRRLQAVQNAAARLIKKTSRSEHITPVLQHLHWLSVRQRVLFKLGVLVYKALHNLLPSYLAADCQLVADSGRRRLHSSDVDTCLVQRTNTRLGDRAFAAAGPRVGNSLPTQLRAMGTTLGQFRRALKTHLFGYWQLQRRVTLFFRCAVYKFTYLLTYLPTATASITQHRYP